mgnify:FL=1
MLNRANKPSDSEASADAIIFDDPSKVDEICQYEPLFVISTSEEDPMSDNHAICSDNLQEARDVICSVTQQIDNKQYFYIIEYIKVGERFVRKEGGLVEKYVV